MTYEEEHRLRLAAEAEVERLRVDVTAALGNLENENVGNAKEWLRSALTEEVTPIQTDP